MLYCNSCGFIGPEHEGNEISLSEAMDMLETGDIDWSEYQEIASNDKFSCPDCSSLDTEITGGP